MRGLSLSVLVIILLSLSFFLTYLVRKYTIKQSMLDIPNERSSHLVATPRGGGLAIVVTFIISLIFITVVFGIVPSKVFKAIVGGGVLVAAIGWIDDKNGVSPRLRLIVHFLAAAWGQYWLGGFTQLDIGFSKFYLGWVGNIIATAGIIWLINLYNFMDGVDGIAGIEAISVALCAAVLFFWTGSQGLAWICITLALAVSGFLAWNWPPARIFMGDVGSGFLGYVFALLSIISEKSSSVPLIIWIMFLGVFIIDATITLIKRVVRGEKLFQAHRTHVYQLAVQVGYSHKQVTLTVMFINVILGIVAVAALQYQRLLLWICLGAIVLLIILHFLVGRRFYNSLNAQEIDRFTM